MNRNSACIFAFTLVSLALFTPGYATQPSAGVFKEGPNPGDLVHAASGVVFPNRIGPFKQGAPEQFDKVGKDVCVDYKTDNHLVVTIYVYPIPGKQTVKEGYKEAEGAIGMQHKDATVADKWSTGEGSNDGQSGIYEYVQGEGAKAQEVRSQLHVFKHGSNYLKFRITYPFKNAKAAEAEILALMTVFQ